MAEGVSAAPASRDTSCDQGQRPSAEDFIQQPGEVIAPEVPDGYVEKIAEELFGLKVTQCKQLNGYDDKNYHIRVSPTTSNPHVTSLCSEGYVMKIMNSLDTRRPAILYAQVEIMRHLHSHGIPTQDTVPSLTGDSISFWQFPAPNGQGGVKTHAVCLRTFIPGSIVYDVTLTPDLCYKLGAFLATLTKALEDFHHPFYDTFDSLWSLNSIPKLTDYVNLVTDVTDRRIVDDVIQQFSEKVLPKRHEIRAGMIHGDPNEQNILVRRRNHSDGQPPAATSAGNDDTAGEYEVSGILDFQDVANTHPLYDLAMCIAYQMMTMSPKAFDPLEFGGHILAGYTSRLELPGVERGLLKVCVGARMVQSLVLGLFNASLDPDNDYVLMTGKLGWQRLRLLWDTPGQQVDDLWDSIVRSYLPQ